MTMTMEAIATTCTKNAACRVDWKASWGPYLNLCKCGTMETCVTHELVKIRATRAYVPNVMQLRYLVQFVAQRAHVPHVMQLRHESPTYVRHTETYRKPYSHIVARVPHVPSFLHSRKSSKQPYRVT